MNRPALRCVRCGLAPDELEEYTEAAADARMAPDTYVWHEEGTLNRRTGLFACTGCYVAMGCPTAPGRGWQVPDSAPAQPPTTKGTTS